MTYEEALKELQEIVNALEAEAISMDELAKKVQRAKVLIEQCKGKLRDTESLLKGIL